MNVYGLYLRIVTLLGFKAYAEDLAYNWSWEKSSTAPAKYEAGVDYTNKRYDTITEKIVKETVE